uniref:Uncharacterized protein n=1 Tax=Anopheles culicifacies TaxID=139723 RepID=A0A182MT29_9DIPT
MRQLPIGATGNSSIQSRWKRQWQQLVMGRRHLRWTVNMEILKLASHMVECVLGRGFCRSTLKRSTCRSSGLATPSCAAISRRSPQSLSTDEISLVVSLGGPPLRKMCLLKDEQDAIILNAIFRFGSVSRSLIVTIKAQCDDDGNWDQPAQFLDEHGMPEGSAGGMPVVCNG